jgi:hypothetical protein
MGVNRSLRHLKRLPVLRALAAFAWLLLVLLPVHGELMTTGHRAAGIGAVTATRPMADMSPMSMASMGDADHEHAPHAAPATTRANAHDCCHGGDGRHDAGDSCHCAATAGSALAASSLIELPPLSPVDTRALPRNTSAPDVIGGPPLRPPAA